MPQVYLLTEDDSDDQIYLYLLEMLVGGRVDPVPVRLRKGGGVGEVRRKMPLLLAHLRQTGPVDGAFFLVAIDNDRALEHPDHAPRPHSTTDPCRHCRLTEAIDQGLPDGQPVPGAIAVPVQMIESWLLLLCDEARYPREAGLPAFAWRSQSSVQRALGPSPPPQLKDLVESEWRASGMTARDDFVLDCILRLRADDLAARSPSFARFRDAVTGLGISRQR